MFRYIHLFDQEPLSTYNVFLGLALIAAFLFLERQIHIHKLNHKTESRLYISIILSMLFGFLGAGLFEVLYHGYVLNIRTLFSSGYTFYGGVISAALVFIISTSLFRLRLFFMINLIIPSLLIAHAFGRIGCFMAGCCYGRPTTFFLGITFPEGSYPCEQMGSCQRIHPTQLYESAFLFILFFVILKWIPFQKRLAFYLLSYGIFRFLIEFVRADDRGDLAFTALTPSQFISLILGAVGILLWFLKQKKEPEAEKN
jgi:phosphatidylglycerol---prolipoprotein diacylglyceryl transferase